MNTTTLVTGAAGFIGFHLARRLLEQVVRSSASTISMTTTTSHSKRMTV